MRKIGKGTKVITADSKQWNMTDNEYLPGGLINVISQRYTSIIESSKIQICKIRKLDSFSISVQRKKIRDYKHV